MKKQIIVCIGLTAAILGCAESKRETSMAVPQEESRQSTVRTAESPAVSPKGPINLDENPQTRSFTVHPDETRTGELQVEGHPRSAKDDEQFAVVKVFYGTDRASGAEFPWFKLAAVVVPALLAVCFALFAFRSSPKWNFSLAAVCLLVAVWLTGLLVPQLGVTKVNEGVEYGDGRGSLVVGTCDVTIPKNHVPGELESPLFLRLEFFESTSKHVVLADVQPLSDGDFYGQLQQAVSASDRDELLVFVHGYNVSFEDAARRTAQISYDLGFPGAPVFFSWPSQGGLFEYTIDETNVEWCVPDLKQFLLDLRQKSGARAINLIAHSMGNRAMTAVLQELALEAKQDGTLFNEVVLAAPDIDVDVFRRRIAPAIIRTANHVTLYASANDQALLASKQVHGYPRAGNSADGVVVVPGIETIDVSEIDTSLLGHGYVGGCEEVLNDMHLMFFQSLRAGQRHLLSPVIHDRLTWWEFRHTRENTTASPARVQQFR